MASKFWSDLFIDRHLGLGDNDESIMLNKLGFNNIDQFINHVIPEDIQLKDKSSEILPQGCSHIAHIKIALIQLLSELLEEKLISKDSLFSLSI